MGATPGDPGVPAARAEDRQNQGILLIASGCTYDEVAKQLGYADRGGAYKAVQAGLKRRYQETVTQRDELIAQQMETIRLIIRGLMPKTLKGDPRSAEVMIRALERLARLTGTDAPAQVNMKITDEMMAEINDLVDTMASLDAQEAAQLLAKRNG